MALEQKLENISGNLKDAYKQVVPGTVLGVDQLMKERITNHELRDLWFYTADGEVYSVDNEIPTLRITREATNPVLKSIDTAFGQLTTSRNYLVPSADFAAVKAAADTVTIDLTKLGLSGKEKEWYYLAVDTSQELSKYNAEEQKLLGRVFGAGSDYAAVMEMLRQSRQRIKETKVFVLNLDYVRANASVDPVGRASWLLNFDSVSLFDASGRDVYGNGRLRGVRRVIAEGDAPKNEVPSEIKGPTMEEILDYATPFVAELNKKQFKEGLRNLYKL